MGCISHHPALSLARSVIWIQRALLFLCLQFHQACYQLISVLFKKKSMVVITGCPTTEGKPGCHFKAAVFT